MKLVLVEWDDAQAHSVEWIPKDGFDQNRTIKCISVGILEEDGDITVHQSRSEVHKSQAITIPRGCIKRIRTLKVASNGKDNSLGALA